VTQPNTIEPNTGAALALVEPAGAVAVLDPAMLAGQLAPSSIAQYRADMRHYGAWCQAQALDPLDASTLAQYRAALAAPDQPYSPATINRRLAAVKRLVKEAASQGRLDGDTAARFAGVEGVKASALRDRRRAHARTRIAPADMRRLCTAPDLSTPRGLRDAALLAVLASSGCRISEVCGLQVGNLYARAGGYFVSVLGKGQAEPREAPLSKEAYELVQRWIGARPVLSVYVFIGWQGRGRGQQDRPRVEPITPAAAWQIVQGYARACDLAHIKPHDFRRFVGTQLAARDIRQAQRALGHKRIDTTARHYVLDELAPGLTDGLY
jgi:integrase/recombinase XerD